MGFLYHEAANAPPARSAKRVIPIELMKEHGCAACSFDVVDTRRMLPKVKPIGDDDRASVYLLGPAPQLGAEYERPWSKDKLRVITNEMPDSILGSFAMGYAVRCAPLPGDSITLPVSMCCSKYANESIEQCKPRLVVGFGPVALTWALGFTAQEKLWRGRRWPIKVGEHVCWYQHSMDVGFVEEMQGDWGTEWTNTLKLDLQDAFRFARQAPRPPTWVEAHDRPGKIVQIVGTGDLDYEELCFELETLAESGKELGIDLETTALRPYEDDAIILTCAISDGEHTVAFCVDHPLGWPENMRPAVKRALVECILNSGLKVAHHLAFEMEWLCVKLSPLLARRTEWGDSYAAAHTLDERQGGKAGDRGGVLSLGMVTLQHFGFDLKSLSNLDTRRLLQYPVADVLRYNAMDARWCLLVHQKIERDYFRHDDNLQAVYDRKVRRVPTLVMSQIMGLEVDVEYAREWDKTFESESEEATRLIRKAVEVRQFERELGYEFSPTNSDHVLILLRDIMKRPEVLKASGAESGDESVISSIPKEAGIAPPLILKVRQADKLRSTYITPLLTDDPDKRILYSDGRLHTNYNQLIAETGRLSSDEPNNQNWPKHKRKEVRGVIVSPGTDYMLAADYGQIEARVVAMCSDDRNLVEALWTAFDIHGHWADRFLDLCPPDWSMWVAEEFEVDYDDKKKVRKELRQLAKNMWVFPMFFGASHKSAARNMHIDLDIAEEAKKEFWAEYPGVLKWQQRTKDFYEKKGYVETLGGNRRRGVMTVNQIINLPIQGTAAEIVLDRMCALSELAEVEERPQLQPPLNVHDDLTFYIPEDSLEEDVEDIARVMCDYRASYVNVPILVEVLLSPRRWNELKEVGVYRSDTTFGFHKR